MSDNQWVIHYLFMLVLMYSTTVCEDFVELWTFPLVHSLSNLQQQYTSTYTDSWRIGQQGCTWNHKCQSSSLPLCIVLGFNYGKVLCQAICVGKLARLLPRLLSSAIQLPWCFSSNAHCTWERQVRQIWESEIIITLWNSLVLCVSRLKRAYF